MSWPASVEELMAAQHRLGAAAPPPWVPAAPPASIGGCFICSPSGKEGVGQRGDPTWAGAAITLPTGEVVTRLVAGPAGAPYAVGLLALREGPLLELAVRRLPSLPDVLLVNATGRDHPKRAGLALHLGAILGLPTIGITHRPLAAAGDWPEPRRGASTSLLLDGEPVANWLCTQDGTRPLVVHAAWRTDLAVAVAVALQATSHGVRTPEPIRRARQAARTARAVAEGRR